MSWKTRTTQCDPLKASYCLPKSHATQASKLAVQDPRKSSCGGHWKAGHIPKINNVLEIAGGLACAKVNKILKIHKGVPKSPNHGRHSPATALGRPIRLHHVTVWTAWQAPHNHHREKAWGSWFGSQMPLRLAGLGPGRLGLAMAPTNFIKPLLVFRNLYVIFKYGLSKNF